MISWRGRSGPLGETRRRGVGFNAADTGKILGGNYARVFTATIA